MSIENNFVINAKKSIKDALIKIDKNKKGIIIAEDDQGVALGIATDGDIRRYLIEHSLAHNINEVINRDFVYATSETPREEVLKKLDQKIKAIPILDKKRKVIDIITSDNFPLSKEQSLYYRARSPVRVSFGGGGSDLTHFFEKHGGAVINATLSIYSHATLRIRNDGEIHIYSKDLDDSIILEDIEAHLKNEKEFGLILAVIRTIKPDFGFDLYLYSDYPKNSGLGGSAVVSASILGCFNQLRRDQWTKIEIAELAFQAERIYLDIAGGWQDQYATTMGGFNFMEFKASGNLIHPVRLNADIIRELEESLVLCDSGSAHDSGEIHKNQKENLVSDADITKRVKENTLLTYQMREDLLRGELLSFGKKMDKAWELKRSFSKKISNSYLDSIYNDAKENGAMGGKLLGAGGGGFFLFFVPPERKLDLLHALSDRDLKTMPFIFDERGLTSWRVREQRN
jgi:D-glycero-alpha-D-manno-heptose-7-phosphate kinase